MKYIAILLVVIGLSAIGLCIALRVQFNAAVAEGIPNFDEYPLLKPFIPGVTSSRPGMASADQVAETTIFRIYSVGVGGFFIAIVGSFLLVVAVRSAKEP